MKQSTTHKAHPYRHVRRNGIVVYVTAEHRDRLYRRGDMPANYPMPAIHLQGYIRNDWPFSKVHLYLVLTDNA